MSNTLFSIDDIERLGTRARRENATNLFNGMAQLDNNMPATRFEGLVREVVGSIEGDEHREADKRRADEGSLPTGYFSAMDSAGLLAGEHRVYGFLQAIRRTPNVRRAIDIGTGSSALLAIATAVFQQKTERIVAYEINEVAAECARRVIELCGFEDLIEVVADNALDVPVKEADLVVSETFHRGLGNELGAKIMQHYGGGNAPTPCWRIRLRRRF